MFYPLQNPGFWAGVQYLRHGIFSRSILKCQTAAGSMQRVSLEPAFAPSIDLSVNFEKQFVD